MIENGCTQLNIQSGIFNGKVTNLGVISGGTFNEEVENSSTGSAWIGTIYTSKITLGSGAQLTTASGCNTVTYRADGSEYARQAVKSGVSTSALTIKPEKTGYTFDEWYTEDGSTFDFADTNVEANLSLDAKWNECKEHEYNDNNICTKCGYKKITYSGSSRQHPTVAETTNGTITLSSSCI